MSNGRKPISAKTRYKVFDRDGYACQCCGGKAPNVTLQIDHIKPLAKGGSDKIENLRAVCITCNLGKSDSESVSRSEPVPVETVPPPIEAGKPWSTVPQTRIYGRYAPELIRNDFNVKPKVAAKMVETWLMNNVLSFEVRDTDMKVKGLRVIGSIDY